MSLKVIHHTSVVTLSVCVWGGGRARCNRSLRNGGHRKGGRGEVLALSALLLPSGISYIYIGHGKHIHTDFNGSTSAGKADSLLSGHKVNLSLQVVEHTHQSFILKLSREGKQGWYLEVRQCVNFCISSKACGK